MQLHHFDGLFDVRLLIGDVFKFKDFNASLIGDTLLINQYDFGLLRVDASATDLRSPANFNIQLTADTMQLLVKFIDRRIQVEHQLSDPFGPRHTIEDHPQPHNNQIYKIIYIPL